VTGASAVPENLYNYSDHCTRGAKELQDWVRGVLSPAFTAYDQGGGSVVAMDHEVISSAAATYATDRDVRRVGLAFQRAGSAHPMPGVPFGPSANDLPGRQAMSVYTIGEGALEAQLEHQAQLDAGAALAAKMTTHRDSGNLAWITQQLDEHASDPFFAAGFYNGLSADQIAQLMGRRGDCTLLGNDEALANALASGAVTPDTAHHIGQALGWLRGAGVFSVEHWHITTGTQRGVLQALAANPAAARNLVSLLTDGDLGSLIQSAVHGDLTTQPSTGGTEFASVIKLLSSAALAQPGPAALSAFMKRVAGRLDGMDLTGVPHSGMVLLQFASVGIAGSMTPPPPDLSPTQLQAWAGAQGTRVDALLAAYLNVIKHSNGAHDHLDSLMRGIAEGAVLNILPWGRAVETGWKMVDNLVIGGLQSWVGVLVDPHVQDGQDRLEGDGGKPKLLPFAQSAGGRSGEIALWTQLAAHHYILNPQGRTVKLNGDPEQNRALLADMTDHPGRYTIRGDRNITLETLRGRYSYPLSLNDPNSKSIRAIGGD